MYMPTLVDVLYFTVISDSDAGNIPFEGKGPESKQLLATNGPPAKRHSNGVSLVAR